jgi:Holliday junction resolvasome RuvABC DNA-binding subunit
MELSIWKDAKGALMGLGYREQDIQTILKQAWESQSPRPERAEDLIRTALRYLS